MNMETTAHQSLPSSASLSVISLHPALVLMVVGLMTFCYFQQKRNKKSKKTPPGPRGLPFLGCILQLIRNPLGKLREYADTYGPVYTMKVGPVEIVVLNSIEAMREAFITKGSVFNNRPDRFKKLLGVDGGLVLLQHGKFHNEQRMLFSKVMRKMDNSVYDNCVSNHIDHFNQALENSKGSSVDICPLIDEVIFACVGQMTFGVKTEVSHIRKLVKGNLSNNPFLVLSGKAIPENIKPKISKYVDMSTNFQKSMKNIIELVMERRQSNDFHHEFSDIIDGFLHTYGVMEEEHECSGKSGSPFLEEASTSNQQLAAILLDCYQAGMEATTAQTLWVFLYLARNVHVQRKIQEEMDQVIGRDNTPSIKHKNHHPYTLATISEVQRIRPAASLGAPHSSTLDSTLSGMTFQQRHLSYLIYGLYIWTPGTGTNLKNSDQRDS
ncbi:cytochrome P450 2C25-like [Amphiura filiformis]|uniref:cytochrome P450 2C25-like n=1 Tax=Amphiura filiformis TaxID=82378 RepID=UPI003B228431